MSTIQDRFIITTERSPETIRYTFNVFRNRVVSVEYKQGDVESQIWERKANAPDALKRIFVDVHSFIRNEERRDALESIVEATKPVQIRQ